MAHKQYNTTGRLRKIIAGITAGAAVFLIVAAIKPAPAVAAACQDMGKGIVTTTATLPDTATYRVWSRIMAPDSTHNSYYLQIDDNCYLVGGNTGIATNAWTWVDYQNRDTNAKIDVALSKGSHNIKLIGNDDGVKLDRVVFTSDLLCTPTGDGSNCKDVADTKPPTVNFTAPTDGIQVSGAAYNVTADAVDESGPNKVTKVEFFVNSASKAVDTTSPFGFTWDTTTVANGTQTLTAKAYDQAGNVGTATISVNVQNLDTQPPTVPANLRAGASAYNKVDLSWTASTDNDAIASYVLFRDGLPLKQVAAPATNYQDTTTLPATKYNYQVKAIDVKGNSSALSSVVSVTTPSAPDTQAPSVPGNLTASAQGSSQINLNWQPSTDNVGVQAYDVYRSAPGVSAKAIATVTTTSFGDSGLNPSTTYTYQIRARDAAGNTSDASVAASATTGAVSKQRNSAILGFVTDANTNRGIRGGKVALTTPNKRSVYRTTSKGFYGIGRLAAGRYSLQFKAQGYTPSSEVTVDLAENTFSIQNMTLRRK